MTPKKLVFPLKSMRLQKDLTQTSLSRLIGTSSAYITWLDNGIPISTRKFIEIAQPMGYTDEEILLVIIKVTELNIDFDKFKDVSEYIKKITT